VLLGLIKKIQRKRPELRVIIASATLQVDTFTNFFRHKKPPTRVSTSLPAAAPEGLGDVVAVSVEGRQYPVDIEYLTEPCSDYLTKTIETVLAIDKHEGRGDVLVFLPGQDEIDFVVRSLQDKAPAHLMPLPLYATLPAQMQQQVFLPVPRHVARKVIVATNIAETSVTLDGVVFVVDSCFVKLAFFNPFSGVESLVTTSVSKASATQRAGRAGRVQPGKCFRLCTQDHFETHFPADTIPQMQRTNLASVALHLLSMGVQDLAHFAFVSPPSPEALIRALELLFSLGAIDHECRLIEPLGTQMAEFPVEPMLAKVLLSSFQYRCTREVLSIASMLSVGDVFVSARGSKDRRAKISDAMEQFAQPEGDHLSLLEVYDEFLDNGRRRSWCEENMVSYQALTRATEIRRHLQRYVQRFCGTTDEPEEDDHGEDDIKTAVLKCFVSGYFANAARLHYDGTYRTVRDGRVVQIHPTSVFYYMGRSPDWLIFHQSVLTTDEYIRDLSRIDPRWLVAIAPDFYRTRDVSAAVSGTSGDLGLPKALPPRVDKQKPSTKKGSSTETSASSESGRILFRKPTKAKDTKPALPVHIGKSKGGLRSQF
jgi:ATP-dependent RNA helicase DDX35